MSRSFRLLTEYREPSPSMEGSSTATEYRVPRIEYRHRVSRTEYRVLRVSSTVTEYGSIEYRHRVSSTEYRVLTEYREPSPSIEVWSTVSHRGSSTVTEWRVPSTEYRVTNIETRINMSSSRITENGVPSNEQQTISANIASIVRSSVQSDSNLETRKNV
jgi:hypothetical protein